MGKIIHMDSDVAMNSWRKRQGSQVFDGQRKCGLMAQALRELEWGRRKCSWGANPISRATVHDIWESKRAEGNSVGFSRARGGGNFPIREVRIRNFADDRSQVPECSELGAEDESALSS